MALAVGFGCTLGLCVGRLWFSDCRQLVEEAKRGGVGGWLLTALEGAAVLRMGPRIAAE